MEATQVAAPAVIGREHPASVLRAEIDRTAESHGGLVLVTGEAGIGKTTLVTDAADEARRRGALVLSGSCWHSENAPGYWPWVQVLRALRRGTQPGEWAAAEAAAGAGLSVLLGESAGITLDGLDEAGPTDAFRLYDAVVTALVSVSQSRPVVAVLDDLHWADPASLRLLEFAAQHTWFERVLLVGTYRDAEVEAVEHPLRPLLTPLLSRARTVTLTGLEPDDVGRLLTRTAGTRPGPELVAEVHRRTGGNPFFVEQTARLWQSGGSVTAIAPGVRDAVRRRLAALPDPVGDVLRAACVLGGEFHRQVLAATVAAPVAQVDRLLEQAVAARLVVARGAGRFAFVHDLVRETLYDALDDEQRRSRHATVVRALEGAPSLADRIVPGALARHAHLAGTDLDPEQAARLLVAAAREASTRLAFDESIGHYRRALEIEGLPDTQRVIVSLDLGHELRHHSTEKAEGWAVLTEAATLARRLGEPELLARVALSVYRAGGGEDDHAELKRELIHEARRALVPDGDHGAPLDQQARELTVHLGALARTAGDDEALGFSLWTLHDTIWGPGTAAERLRLTDEMVEVARRTGDLEMEQYATSLSWVARLERGDPGYAERLAAFVALTDREGDVTRMRIGALVDQGIIAGFQGRFADATAHFDEALGAPEPDAEHFSFITHHLRWAVSLMRGRFAELAKLHASLGERDYSFHRLIEAITAVESGDTATASRYYAETEASRLPRMIVPLWLRFQAQLAAATGDPEACARARADLTPYADQWLVALFGCDISGPVTHWLGGLDLAERRWDDAVARFTEAHRTADALHARPWSVLARLGLAEALLGRAAPDDDTAAANLLDDVQREAADLGMEHVPDRVRALREAAAGRSAMEGAGNEFRLVEGVWRLSMAGRTVHVPNTKGLRDLHTLLSRPGTDVPAVRLLAPEGGELVTTARSLGGDAVLDDEAKAAYRRRLALLDEEIDTAVERGADARAAELDRERAALLAELRAAAGLGGRPRRLGDEAERARKTVTARIRDTLRKLDERHPELAEHLRATVSTGASCRYQPERGISWRL
ncbi:putative ATPase [Prauserella shujinwangii]|uniref:Putative ATPase n=1 Tax=Prauserella shujinwangii TaxID=1453103 RepID=A0A2T0LPY6_9PSEU|nr:AAA family ATPase [Prauserella shujinwangii]PRX45405.1 putative ATPase [Prauserella shujinwangii]